MMSAYWKIPLQALVLIVGVLMFAFYLFTPPPMLFNPIHDPQVRASARAADYAALEAAVRRRPSIAAAMPPTSSPPPAARATRRAGAATAAAFKAADDEVKKIRADAVGIVREVSSDKGYNDVNYVFPTFVTTHLPVGLVG